MLCRSEIESFSNVYLKFQKPILKYISSKLRDRAVAEEVTQDVFLRAYRARGTFDPSFELSTWLWTIARNTLADWYRKNRRVLMCELESSSLALELDELPSREADPERALLRVAREASLRQRIQALTGLQREVLSMRTLQQLTYCQIALQLRLSLSAVKCLAHRAKTKLITEVSGGAVLE